MKTILVTGATGYVGGRLIPKLVDLGYNVRVLVRNFERLKNKSWYNKVEVFNGDVLIKKSLSGLFKNVDTAYYLIHSMEGYKDFSETDLIAAKNFSEQSKVEGLKKIIYLGGLADETSNLSNHLKSRLETGKVLSKSGVDVTEFRANVIVGSGSLSFEMIRNLTERIPIMICPYWVYTKTQPIAIGNVLDYLIQSLDIKIPKNKVIEIGGKNVFTYGDMIKQYAQSRNLIRFLIPVPVLTPKLSSYWVHWTTPLSANITRPLVEGLKNESIVKSNDALKYFPDIKLLSYKEAVELAISRFNEKSVETSWSDSLTSSKGNDSKVAAYIKEGMIIETRRININSNSSNVFEYICSIGGEKGWLYADFLWIVRGYIDLLFGGVGLRRGRRHPFKLKQGDALDFWRVEKITKNKLLRFKAEMKLPGQAWLEYKILNKKNSCQLIQKAYFMPTGLLGLIYWYTLYPLHKIIFRGLVRAIKKSVESHEFYKD
ncbi:MAG: SDR family oxidoreductase [Pelagibacteraceae bacterium TMED124]|nr:NAD(P)-dependent oxidoreductase [Candidatus Neomarinimicrobiota bacterium]RPG19106.1 MAG: SDR family oxidoreductase [Pelagibacteraceae bacterium TMED124]|tara:strand:+ start:9177 stop:10634 length:1458 start_codon:yes stop_codon:yes gene_type:complete